MNGISAPSEPCIVHDTENNVLFAGICRAQAQEWAKAKWPDCWFVPSFGKTVIYIYRMFKDGDDVVGALRLPGDV